VNIATALDPDETLEIGVFANGHIESRDVFVIDRSMLSLYESQTPSKFTYHGEIQGVVHALYKETKRPKLAIRDLYSQQLVDCFFSKDMYQGVVSLLRDENAVIFVEGEVFEDAESGIIKEIEATEFTPAPEFEVNWFEAHIGAFPEAITGGGDTAALLDNFREP
jgi:hypothetical protein